MTSRNVQLIKRFYHEMWNRFDTSIIPELLADDIEFRGSLGQWKRGHAEFAAYVDFIRNAFPDFHNRIEDIVTEGDRSFARLTYTGTHSGTVFSIEPTGRRIEYAGAALFRIREQRIVSVWVLGDIHGLLGQLRQSA